MSIRYSRSPAPLRVELRPSHYLRLLLIGLGLLALAALAATALQWALRLVLALLVTGYVALSLRHHTGLWGIPACTAIRWDGAIWQWQAGAVEHSVSLQHATLWPGLLVLNFCDTGTRKSRVLVLLPDSAAAVELRRLRVYLNHLPVFAL